MWFKNLTVYRMTASWQLSAAQVEEAVSANAQTPIGLTQPVSTGWAPIFDGLFAHVVNRQILLQFKTEKKVVPSSALKAAVAKRVDEIERMTGRKPGKNERREIKDDALLASLHEPRYNMLAYPWSGPYQQSNQWAIETLAMLAEPSVGSRVQARAWLRAFDYRPTTLYVSPLKRLGARIGTAHIAFDDHPFDRRMAGQIETVTVESVFAWLQRAQFAEAPRVLRTRPSDLRVPDAIPVVTPRRDHAEVDLLQAARTAILVQIDAAAPDLTERPVVGITQRKG